MNTMFNSKFVNKRRNNDYHRNRNDASRLSREAENLKKMNEK